MIQCKGLHKALGKRTRLYTNCSLDLLEKHIALFNDILNSESSFRR